MTEKSTSLIISTKTDLNSLRFNKYILIGKITNCNWNYRSSAFYMHDLVKAITLFKSYVFHFSISLTVYMEHNRNYIFIIIFIFLNFQQNFLSFTWQFHITGLFKDDKKNAELSEMISDTIFKLINENQDVITDTGINIITAIFNKLMSNVNLGDLINPKLIWLT